MWTVRILHLISSFCLVCCIDVFCLSFFYKKQCKHFRGTAFIPSIYSHSLRGCTPAIIYNNSCSNIEILVLISIQLAADNWQICIQSRQLSLSAWFKLSWIYVTRLWKEKKSKILVPLTVSDNLLQYIVKERQKIIIWLEICLWWEEIIAEELKVVIFTSAITSPLTPGNQSPM